MKRHPFVLVLIVSLAFTHLNCKKEPPVVPPEEKPPVYQQSIFLSVVDSGLTEIYLKLSITDSLVPRGFSLYRNNAQILNGSLFGKETTLVDTTVQFNSAYSYRAFRMETSFRKDSSNTVMTKTLDTTSHEFTWKTFILGDGSASIVNDVTIISEDNIWVVGEINILDSIGNVYETYNAARWNGNKWNMIKIPVRDYGTLVGIFQINAIYSFSKNDIWFASYADLIHWDGQKYESKAFFMLDETFNGQVNKICGLNGNELFIAGRNGALYRYANNVWHKIETGTSLDIYDINVNINSITGESEVIAVGAKQSVTSDHKLFVIQNNNAIQLLDSGIIGSQAGIWHKAGKIYYCVGNGMYFKSNINSTSHWNKISKSITPYYIYDIDGTDVNNIFACGSFGELLHFNGITWKSFKSVNVDNTITDYLRVSTKGNVVVAAGYNRSRGIVSIGSYNN